MLSGEPERRRRRPRTGDAHSKGVGIEAVGLGLRGVGYRPRRN